MRILLQQVRGIYQFRMTRVRNIKHRKLFPENGDRNSLSGPGSTAEFLMRKALKLQNIAEFPFETCVLASSQPLVYPASERRNGNGKDDDKPSKPK